MNLNYTMTISLNTEKNTFTVVMVRPDGGVVSTSGARPGNEVDAMDMLNEWLQGSLVTAMQSNNKYF